MAEPEKEIKKKSVQDHKKEAPNNEKRVLSEIKVAGMEEPVEENVTKTSDNLEMDELTPAPVPESD